MGDAREPAARSEASGSRFDVGVFAVDDPLEGNEAHCEVRVRRTSRQHMIENDDAAKRKSPATRAFLKHALAQRFRVLDLAQERSQKGANE
jgi:hypothetical protein